MKVTPKKICMMLIDYNNSVFSSKNKEKIDDILFIQYNENAITDSKITENNISKAKDHYLNIFRTFQCSKNGFSYRWRKTNKV